MPLLKHPLRRRMHCTPAAEGSSCNLTLPAAGLAVLQLRLPGAAPPDGSPPEPCTATFQTVLAPSLVLRCLLGVWLVLFAHRALATRPGQAALRLCNAAAQAAAPWKRQLRAAWAAAAGSAAAVAFIRAHIDDWPAEGRWAPGCRLCQPTRRSCLEQSAMRANGHSSFLQEAGCRGRACGLGYHGGGRVREQRCTCCWGCQVTSGCKAAGRNWRQ